MIIIRSINRFLIINLAFLGLSISPVNAISLNESGGQLLGAFDVGAHVDGVPRGL